MKSILSKFDKVLKELDKEFNKPVVKQEDELKRVLKELNKEGFPYSRIR